jgi:hypothetical protein
MDRRPIVAHSAVHAIDLSARWTNGHGVAGKEPATRRPDASETFPETM